MCDADNPQAIARRIDYLHQMLGLQIDEARCGKKHPVCKEYLKPGGRAALRFFPKGGNDGKTIVNMNGTESALFVNSLVKTQLFSSPALSATDFVFEISALFPKRKVTTEKMNNLKNLKN